MMPAVSQEIDLLRQTLRRFVTEEVIPLQHEHGLTIAKRVLKG